LPLLNPYIDPNILHLSWSHCIPVWEVGKLAEPATLELLASLQPDLLVVACFPDRLPQMLLQLPRYGSLNLHPSLLPAYRGPAPLFWQARQGETRTGVTLHFLDESLDSGDIVAQSAWPWPDGLAEAELERLAAEAGADLVTAAVEQAAQGQALPRRPQSEMGSSYFPWPAEQDFVISTGWPARRTFNFLRAAARWPLGIAVGAEYFPIRIAISYESEQRLGQPYVLQDDELRVQFQPGVLRVKI
jgi:methionyl-tRNA formyltransferase